MEKRSILNCPTEFDRTDLLHLLSLSTGRAIATQLVMGNIVIGNNGWNVDIRNRRISFGDKTYNMGIIGTEGYGDGTWLWGWANTQSNIPEIATAPSRRAKKLLSDVLEFTAEKFMLDELHTGHNLSMVTIGVSEENLCYYRCPYNGGALFVTVEGLPDEVFAPLSVEELAKQYLNIISTFYCDHRLLAAGFLYQNGNEFVEENGMITGSFSDQKLYFSFEEADGLSRVANVQIK